MSRIFPRERDCAPLCYQKCWKTRLKESPIQAHVIGACSTYHIDKADATRRKRRKKEMAEKGK